MMSSTAASAAGGGEAAAASRPPSDDAPASQQAAQEPRQTEQQQDAPDVCSQDVGNAVHLEHVNLEVTDLDLARLFYSEGLGLTPDPDTLGWQRGGPHVTWYNLGRQQLHIVKGPAQTTRGTITLKLPSPEAAAERLARLQEMGAFEGTLFSPPAPRADGIGAVAVTCPWGQRFLLVDAAPGFPWPAGIVELRLPCFSGSAHFIAHFYAEVLGARVQDEGGGAACVLLGPGSCLRFQEDASLGEHSEEGAAALWSGWHVAFYVASFGPAFQRVLSLGINLLDHPYRDKSPDATAALANAQFRFRDVVWLDGQHFGKRGSLLYRLGHEVRSLHHPGFMRPLYNRRD